MNTLTITLVPSLHACNCWLLRDETGVGAIVDPGGDFEDSHTDRILSACEAEKIDVKQIILTHAHFDHMLSLEGVRKATGAPLAIHGDDTPALADPEISYMTQVAAVTKPCKPADRRLCDGATITLGNSELKIMHTPGHTPGSICILCGDLMITGDTLFKETIGRSDLIGGNTEVLFKTLELFKSLDRDYTIFPGHGPTSTVSEELKRNPYLQ